MNRTDEIFAGLLRSTHERVDRMFLYLLIGQWLFGVVLASVISPYTYFGDARAIHVHVEIAIGFGALINSLPIFLIITRPGWWGTRHAIAFVQILWSALFIMFTNGRIATHFHIFGSLAFLALYRDWRVLLTATAVVIGDHLIRGTFFPATVYGVSDPQWWTFVEHALWVVFEDAMLILGIGRNLQEMRETSKFIDELEANNISIEKKVEHRTRALAEAKDRFRALVENIEAVPFEYVISTRELAYIAPQAERILHVPLEGDVLFGGAMHPDDAMRVRTTLEALSGGMLKAAGFDYRVIDPNRQTVHLRVVASAKTHDRVHGVAIDITKQTNLEHELRHAQKLESVGRLAAGVAHEINTPIQFVNDSVRFLQTAVEDVMLVVGKHQRAAIEQLSGDRGETALAREANEAEAAIDLPFLQTAMPEAIGRAVQGIERVAAIVRSIKAFSHPDQPEMTPADLNSAIESTLTVASSEYRYIADIETTFADLPEIECHIGEINQVVLNLVVNASHAIAASNLNTAQRGTIKIATRIVDECVEIAITDSGTGIPAEIRDRIFDPFFTTKEVGVGTGQGLAIAHSIVVDKHHGKLTFDSVMGKGTTFFVTLPIQQHVREAA